MAPPHPPDFFERDGCTIRAANGPREAGFSEGTWAYRAPECWASPERVAVASDVYAFGTLLWELLVGTPPFSSTTRAGWAEAHSTVTPSVPALVDRDPLADDLIDLAKGCLDKRPADRPESFGVWSQPCPTGSGLPSRSSRWRRSMTP
jgi:serine/threonine protein kinase